VRGFPLLDEGVEYVDLDQPKGIYLFAACPSILSAI
jgi:hypothetical protein